MRPPKKVKRIDFLIGTICCYLPNEIPHYLLDETDTGKRKKVTMTNNDNDSKQLVECSGHAKEALQVYRRRVEALKLEGKCNPGMIAFKELRGRYTPAPRKHGELEGVPIGLALRGRGEAAILGIHQKILSGIDGVKDEPCYAVCISGGYVDDDDHTESDGTIYYTGEGGQDRSTKHQIKDQSEDSVGNAALLRSVDSDETIRVIRGNFDKGYNYLGLYKCRSYTYEPGIHGKRVYSFILEPIHKNQSAAARAIRIDSKCSNPAMVIADVNLTDESARSGGKGCRPSTKRQPHRASASGNRSAKKRPPSSTKGTARGRLNKIMRRKRK